MCLPVWIYTLIIDIDLSYAHVSAIIVRSVQVPGPAPTLYPIGSVAYRQAVQQFEQSGNITKLNCLFFAVMSKQIFTILLRFWQR